MSRVIPDGTHKPERYSFMAESMAEHLEAAVKKGRTDEGTFQKGVLHSAQHYFRSVRERIELPVPRDSIGSGSDHQIAHRALLDAGLVTGARSIADALLVRYASFIDGLEQPHPFEPVEVTLANQLIRFFGSLATIGNEEAYEDRMKGEEDPNFDI